MSKRHVAVVAGFLCLAASGRAAAVSLPLSGTLTIQIASLPPIVVAGAGVALVNGSGPGGHLSSLSLPAGLFQTSMLVVDVTDPGVMPLSGLQLTGANAAGSLSGGPAVIPLAGVMKICLYGECPTAVANLNIPLGIVGNGGSTAVSGVVPVTVAGAPWTLGTATVMTLGGGTVSAMGFRHGPASATSSTAAPSGQLQLVTPIAIYTNIGALATVGAFGVMSLHFTPEPGTLVLLGGGVAALATTGRRSSRQRS